MIRIGNTPVSEQWYGIAKSEGGKETMAAKIGSGGSAINKGKEEEETKDASWVFFAGVIGIFLILTVLAVKGIG